MAPGRKRGGAKGAKANNNLNLGDLVLAKVKGFPAWPAKISKPEDWQKVPDPKKYFVNFFGTEEIAFVAPVDIQPFTRESKEKLLKRCKGKTVKYFAQAVEEISEIFEGLENKSSDSFKDHNDGQTSQLDANFVEMVDDGPSGETSPNDDLYHGPGLERCSHKHSEMVYEDVVSNISPLVNDRPPSTSPQKRADRNDDITSPNVESISTCGAGRYTNSKTVVKVETNRQKSKKITKESMSNVDGVDGINKINSPSGVSATVGVKNKEPVGIIKKKKKLVIDKSHGGLTDDSSKDVDVTGRKTKSETGLVKGNVTDNGVLHPTKKCKLSDDTPKKSQTHRKVEEVRKLTPKLKTKDHLSGKGHTDGSDSAVPGDEDAVQPTKRRRVVLEDMSSPTSMPDSVKSGTQVPVKRRAVRIYDDDDDEPNTPVHGTSSKVVDKVSLTSISVEKAVVVTEAIQDSPSLRPRVDVKESVLNSQKDITEVVEGKLCHTPTKAKPDNKASSIKSPVDAYNQILEPSKVNKSLGKVSGNVSQKKGQPASSKAPNGIYDSGHHSKNKSINDRRKVTLKTTAKSSSRVNDSSVVLKKPSESSERTEFRVDRTTSLADSRNADSDNSMRRLIAVAQAKRKQAQSNNLVNESHTETIGRSPGHVSIIQPTQVSTGVTGQTDDQLDPAEFENRRTSSGHRHDEGSLSGGTEVAVARDAFEGMIETLSRTKESIGRATRHAIDCAKRGIASEVVELLTRKLENESSLNRRVDLFFLVDSITQCSHSHKGIPGPSYIPNIQEALPRILGAAAPPDPNARENRRQCLKVLKLWLERKILPDTLLRRYIEDIGSSIEDSSAVYSSKRPSRAERAIDDPIREMEGMLVDEYGSNATFQLPGLMSCNVFEEDEEEDDILNFLHKEGSGKSILELNTVTGEPETCSTSVERRHCILEDVDGELEMEDVSGHPKDENKFTGGDSSKDVHEDDVINMKMDTSSNHSNEASPLREGSPPLPPESAPSTPPLPSSPPPPLSPPMVPPPPATSSAPPPPPPPFPPPSQTYPLIVGPPPPQVLFPQSLAPSMPSNGHEMYTNPQGSQSKQQFQNGNLPLRTFQPLMPTHPVASQFQYPNPAMVQHPYRPPYGLTIPPDGPRRYGADEQWRPPSNEFGTESQRGVWINNGRSQLSTGPPFVQEGYFRPPMERPLTNNVSFQPTGHIISAGAPIPGHSGSLMIPSHNSWRPA